MVIKKRKFMFSVKMRRLGSHIILSICFFLSLNGDAYQATDNLQIRSLSTKNNYVMCITIPKSGTHMLIRAISALNIKELWRDYKKEIMPIKKVNYIRSINKDLPPNHYKGLYYPVLKKILPAQLIRNIFNSKYKNLSFSHCPYLRQFDQLLQSKTSANFFMIRDPRAMVVSFAFMVHKSFDGQEADLEETILDMITGEQKNYFPWGVENHEAYPLIWEMGLYNFYKIYLPWASAKNFMLIKFEDLVGQKGDGSLQKQKETIKNIGMHLNVKMTKQRIQAVINNMYGGTSTFREGKIDSWKKYFTPKITAAFKKDADLMQLLIDLGYEKDKKW